MFDIREIKKNVPHRFPFLLIDRILDFKVNESVVALKNITVNEGHFEGHFPDVPLVPGVYIIESMAQAACFLLAKSGGGLRDDIVYVLGRVNRMSFFNPVVPGDQLIVTIHIEKKFGDTALVTCTGEVANNLVAKGELMFATRPRF